MATNNFSTPKSNQFVDVSVFNGLNPKQQPKLMPLSLDFTVNNSWAVDLQNMQSRNMIQEVQSMFVDNSLNSKPVYFTFQQSNASIVCPPFSQGTFPVYAPNPCKLTAVSSGSTSTCMVFLGNMPQPYMVWGVNQNSATYNGSGALIVSDPLIEALISAGALKTANQLTGWSGGQYPESVGNQTYRLTKTTTAAQNLITGAPGFYITGFTVQMSGLAVLGAAADVVISFLDNGTVFDSVFFTVPAAAAGAERNIQKRGIYYNSKTAGNLTVTLSAVMTTGFAITVEGGTTSIIG